MMSDATARLRTATEAIWRQPPEGLEGLATLHRPPSADLPKRLYANFDAYWLAGALYQLRELSADTSLDRATLAIVAGMIAETAAMRLTTWGFRDAGSTVSTIVPALKGAANIEELRAILAALVTFIDRVHVWIDATIPWAAMDALAPLPAQGGGE